MRNVANPSSSKSLISLFISQRAKCTNNAFAKFYAAVVITLLCTAGAMGQITNYKFSPSSTTYADITGGTTLIAGGNVALGAATLKSAVTPIGFTFNYLGKDYTDFSVAATGHLRFGTAQVGVYDNSAPLNTNQEVVFAAWDWFTVGTTATGGGVSYVVTGTAPNRVLTAQWKVTRTANTATAYNFQVKLYEGTNKIEFLYGAGSAASNTISIGLNGISAAEHLYVFPANESLYNSLNITSGYFPATGRVFTFTPQQNTVNNTLVGLKPNMWLRADQPILYNRTLLNVPAANRTASSVLSNNAAYNAAKSVLSSTDAWLGQNWSVATPIDHITLDLGSVQTIDGIATMGRAGFEQVASSFTIKVSNDNVNFTDAGYYLRNEDAQSLHYTDFDAPLTCRYVRVFPTDFLGGKGLRLDAYTKSAATTVADNTAMSQWEDHSGNNFDAANIVGAATNPTYKTNQFNFNPAMVFSNAANSQLDMPDQGNIRASFWVSQYTGDGADYDHVLYGGNSPYYHGGVSYKLQYDGTMTDAQSAWWKNGTLGTVATTYDAGATGKPNLISSATKALGTPLSASTISYQSGYSRSWNGPIAEIITYQDLPTTAQQHVIESYLGIKYGLTIDHNYLTADGSMLWDKTANATYHERVFGIGRADSQGFHQRQSKSVKVGAALTVGNNNIIGATNASSVGNDIATDNSYLIFGDNNGDLKLNYTTTVNKYFFNRIWKINEVGTIGSVRISIPSYTNSAATTLPNYYTSFFPNNKVYLAMDDDGNFQNGGTSYVEAVAVGSGTTATYEVNVDLTNAKPYLAWAVDKDMTDSDNDGVVNPDDIDDDNDGILDSVEQGVCTYPDNTLDEITYTGNAPVTTSGTTINAISNANGNWRSSYSNQTLKLPIHLEWTTTTGAVNNAMIGLLPVGNNQNTGNWTDGSYKVYHYSANLQVYKPQGVNTPVNAFVLARPYTAGQKMEIDITATGIVTIKQAGVVLKRFKGRVADYKLAISAAYTLNRAFENVKLTSWTANGVCTDLDTDSDGVVNRLDIDSDGDGCNDAVEGGAAILNATTVPFTNVGTNGLADALESTADSGFINYDDIYDTYAKDNTLSACDDHDNDLVLDYLDIDDDNDGVLDLDEQTSCTSPAEVLEDLLWTGNTTVNAYDNIVSGIATTGAANTQSWTSSYSNQELQLPIHMEFTKPIDNIEGMIGFIPATVAQPANVWNDANSYKYYFATANNYYGKFPSTSWNIGSTGYTATQKFEIDINEAGVLTATVNGVMMHRIQAPKSTYKLVVSAKTGESFYNNVIVTSRGATTVCTDMDTDGDGIINRFDLDSDGDGCNDAVEANVGNNATTVPLTGAVGTNGLVDAKETVADSGIISYASTYANYGLSESQNVCLDSDGDTVGNLRDLDDDNDGVPDAIEMNCTAPLFVHKTSENTTTSKKLTGTILKETGNVDYEIAMSGPGVTNPSIFDGGNGIHFRVDGVSSSVNLNLKLTAVAAENSSTPIAPKVQTVDFGPSVPFNTATLTSVQNEANNIILTWPGGYGVVYDPFNQLSSHNTGDIISSGDLIVQNVAVTGAQINAGQTWKVKLYMHTDADVYDVKASIFGDAALNNEAYGFNVSACAIYDTDTDGLPNHVDTDSDGDGCYDAYEAGAVNTASQQTVTGTFGANGFVSTYETTDDFDATITNAYKATIAYNQAISKEINLCTDTDTDGVSNVTDIDDDNDGILDAEEMSCGTAYFSMPTLTTGATAFLQNLTGTASFGNAGVDYDINLVGVNTVFTNTTINNQFDNSKDGLHFAFTDNDKVYSQTYKLSPSAPTLIKKVRFGVNVPTNQIYVNQVNDAQSITLTWSPDVKAIVYDPNDQLSTHATGDVITTGTTITTRANYTVAASTWKIEFLTNGLPSEFYLQTTHKATTATNVAIEGYGLSADLCFVDDMDGDGVADYLDTDSDDDGCGDAFESSAASTPGGATQTVAGPYGANGFANSLENNDTQDAAITYASSSYMAYSSVSACADTDGDSVPDRNDIDDDNDGILDADEYACGVGSFVKSYVITSGLGMGYGGTFNNGNSKGTGTMSFTDLTAITTVSDVTDASNYKVNDANTTYKFKATIAPTNGIISQLAFGPNLPGNTANAAVVNGQQSITLNWNYPIGGIVYDPDDQLSSHTDGQGINPGDVIVTRANYAVSVSTWKVVIPMNYLNRQVDFTAQFVGVATLGDESFGLSSNICNKVTDLDGDRKANAVDTDSDADGCYDLVESNSGYYSTLTQETILGTVGTNGYSALAETNDTQLATDNYTLSNAFLNSAVKGCIDTDTDGIPNVNDIDDDNDGMLDQTECPVEPAVTKFGFQQIAGTNGRQMYITNKATNVPIGKITIAPVKNIVVDTLIGNENDNSVSGHWVDGASANSADRVMTIKFEPVAPYTSLDLKVLATEGGNGIWGFHPRSLRVDGGIAGDGVIKAIPQRYYLRENYQVGQTLTSSMRMTTAFSGMLSGSSNKVFIQVQYNANATQAAPLVLKYTWNALAGSVFNENFGFQLLELNPSLTAGACDYDNDGINDDLDSDSDNDGCPDTKEAVHGKPYASNTNYIKGPYGTNGFSTLVENNDTFAATYATSGWLPKVTTSPKKDYVNELINTRCIIPFIVPAGPTTFCDPGQVVLNINLNGGTTPTAYQWKKNGVDIAGATANTYTATETGDYTVLLTYADNTTILTDPQDVTENPAPAVPTVTAAPGTTVCLGGTSTLTSSYTTDIQWFQDNAAIAGATAQTYTAAASGNYKVEYTDPVTGCKSASTTQVIVVSTLPLAPVVSVTQTTCSVATGTITVTPSGNTGETYSVDGTTYQVSNIFAGLAAGTYSVTTKNSNGCTSAVTSAVINAQPATPAIPTITAAPGTAICSGGSTTLTSSVATSYQWFKDGTAIVGAINQTYVAIAAGSYTVEATNASGCLATSTATVVTIAPTPTASIAQSISLGNTNCGTSAPVLLTASTNATSPTYIWYKDGVVIGGATAATYTAVVTGSYTVQITSAAGCSFTSTPSVVTTGPSVNVTSGSVCTGQTFTFTADITGFTNPTFAWEYSADGTPTGWASASGTNNTINYVASVAGFYRVIVADSNQTITSCSSELKLFALPTASISSNPSGALCAGQSTVLTATGTVTSPTTVASYQWLDGATPISGATAATYTSTLSGSFSAIITDSNGCQVTTAPTTVTVNPLAATPVSTVTAPSCSVTTGTITITAPVGSGYTYTVDGGTAQSSPIFSGLAVGAHTVVAISPSGCASASVSETIPAAPSALTISGTISGNATPYVATSETYSITAVAGAVSYVWTLPNGWTGTSTSNTIIATTAAMTNNTGTITVKAVNSAGCESAPVLLNVAIKPAAPTANNYTYCQNETAVAVTATVASGGTLNWYVASTGNTAPSSLVPSTTIAGTFSYYVSQTVNGVESDRLEVQVVVNPAPATASTTVTQPSCSVSTGTIFVDSPRGSGLTYSIDGSNYTNTTGQFTNLVAGTYSVTTKNASGCISSASSVTINAFSSSIASAVATLVQPTCNVSTGTITVTSPVQAGLTYSIDGFDYSNTNGIFNNVTPGTYPITIKNMAGCVNTASNVTINTAAALPAAPAATITQPSCTVATGTITITSPVGSGITYSIDGTNYTNTTGIFTGLNPGIYTISAQGAVGCIGNSSSFVVNSQPATPSTPIASVVNPSCTVATGTITVTSPVGTGISYSIDGSTYTNTTGIFTGLSAATYNVTVKNTSGCVSQATVVTVNSISISSCDMDGDGIVDNVDLDNDNDGILDSVENAACNPVDSNCDTDSDGIPNYKDLDSDGDGIKDVVEGAANGVVLDANNDGKADGPVDANGVPQSANGGSNPPNTDATAGTDPYDTDADGDGIPDSVEKGTGATPVDTDGDGTPDYRDLDSDNDGIPDALEGVTDTDGDGIPNYLDKDSDNDGILDSVENAACPTTTPVSLCDTDGDGTPNVLDLDSDGDGIKDVVEGAANGVVLDANNDGQVDGPVDANGVPQSANGGLTPPNTDATAGTDPYDTDADGDGIPDSVEKGTGATPVDTDGDGTPDYRDLDSDNDGIPDAVEKGPNGATPIDTDNDGIPNYKDLDSDGDGVADSVDQCVLVSGNGSNGCANPTTNDVDGDGVVDSIDLDNDNDGILDSVENAACNPVDPNCDTDGDGTPNRLDLDSDGDGIKDVVEGVANGVVLDANNDGQVDGPVDANGVPQSANGGSNPPNTDATAGTDPYDTDADGDGIPDSVEKGTGAAPVDTDGDGIPDFRDPDSDNDGILDAVDGTTDTDTDGTPNYLDTDSDGDGIPDLVEKGTGATPLDTDSDGTPDYLDLDSDGDGIPDSIEKGPNGATPVDTDGDGTPDYLDTDSDGDGIPDSVEDAGCTGTAPCTPTDTDGDGTPNYLDLDSDGDGIPDSIEKGPIGATPIDTDNDGTPDYLDTDSDGDGIPDSVEDAGCIGTAPCTPTDSDGDGVPNYKDLDSDSDGIPDAVEKGPNGATPVDTDGDGTPDYLDTDSDGDGIPDSVEKGTGATPVDTDGDGTPNYLDLDSDGDGIPDSIEKGPIGATPIDTDNDGTPDYLDTDSDGDGIPDSVEDAGCTGTAPCTPTDTDGDGVPNYKDLDSDADGIPDAVEKGPNGATPVDTDNDGTPNYLDLDSDGDGIPDAVEKGPNGATPVDTDSDGTPDYLDLDSDGDGIPDSIEKGPNGATPIDTDNDGTPDYLDTDSDNDGIPDAVEDAGCTGTAPCTPTDTDGDGIPNYLDLDSDGDSIPDAVEKGPNGATPIDTDSDGTPDYLDLDTDGDGIPDALEDAGCSGTAPCTPTDTDGDGIPNYMDKDSDNDGILDSVENAACPITTPVSLCDTDGDGTPNYMDLDSDNDGINDVVEGVANGVVLDTNNDGKADGPVDANGVPQSANGGSNPPNTDGTAGTDPYDTDADGDGIIDSKEGTADKDTDGIPNYRDLDADGDGVVDNLDDCPLVDGQGSSTGCPPDVDGDGIVDTVDLDDDNDGILDSVENAACSPVDPNCDTDGDGVPNRLDKDSDGDGINDLIEGSPNGTNIGSLDSNNDGILDGPVDANGVPQSVNGGLTPPNTDGTAGTDPYDTDADGDGISDNIEKGSGAIPVDTDSDGTPDYRDLDTDGDGIPDTVEKGTSSGAVVDTDGDGIPDYKDTDSDNDGIPDALEGVTDTDGDGIPNYLDKDSDNDGILDSVENAACPTTTPVSLCDTDGDGTPNVLDLDSDGDGIKDVVEGAANGVVLDANNDGKADGPVDANGVPQSANGGSNPPNTDATAGTDPYDTDADGDGIPDSVEKGTGATPVDTDGDGTPDYRDLDSDNDGIPDALEGVTDTDGDGIPNYLDKDSDNDGILDSVENAACPTTTPVSLCDTDGDGTPNVLDLDSDGDGIKDVVEGAANGVVLDANNDGQVDGPVDANGVPQSANGGLTPPNTDATAGTDPYDTDADGDGIPDSVEKGTGATPVDTDGDGTPDYRDLDSDNDGIPDAVEKGPNGASPVDTDNDGTPDYQDIDSDGDGVADSVDQCVLVSGNGSNGCPTGPDSDADGIVDSIDLDDDNDGILDSVENAACNPVDPNCDTDGDGTPNVLDLDSDGDGIKDVVEGVANGVVLDANNDGQVDGPVDANGVPQSANGGLTPPNTDATAGTDPYDTDADGDGIPDSVEKGTGATPVDTDGDGTPDYRDLDSDNDGIPDAVEKGPNGATPVDTDNDGTPDYRDLDSDGDGIPDSVEKGPNGATPIDTDNDGTPDYRDLDSDGDGIPDAVEKGPNGATPIDTDNDGIPDYRDLDSDGDGIPDAVEKGPNGATPVDTDNDGTPDYRDLDSDNDGIPDAVEKGPNGATPVDTDNDGTPDYRDLDSDGDGIPDSVEKGPNGATPIDTDNDGTPDYRDLDSDGDGIPDAVEKGPNGATPVDTDNDGTPDYRDLDSDGDGIPDSVEKGPNGATPVDTDNDGTPDYRDLDSDGDGIPDSVEKGPNGATPVDTDGDGMPDYRDLDSDADGVLDSQERLDGTNPLDPCDSVSAHRTLPLGNGFLAGDCDGDGLSNEEEIGLDPTQPQDNDKNGIADYLEVTYYKDEPGEIEVYNSLSPNGDGDNDVFVIRNIENYPNNTVSIYNRWGVLVFEVDGYGQNDKVFTGTSNGRATIQQSEQLPEGTYFYILRYVNTAGVEKQRSGYLYIKR